MARKGERFKKYSSEMKQQIIKLYLDEHLSKGTIASLLLLLKAK
ncbi:MAG: hypothetical protein ACUVQF_07415 [Fervidobacterium sp.]